MLTTTLIARHIEAQQWSNLMNDLSKNGLALPLSLMVRLSSSQNAVMGLALRRITELARRAGGLTHGVAKKLHDAQSADGSFESDPLATAAVAAGLGAVLADGHGLATDPTAQQITIAKERAIHALAGLQREDGLFDFADDRSEQDRSLVAAFILVLLGRDETFTRAVRVADLLGYFESNEDQLEPDTARLWAMARANTRPVPSKPNAVAA